MVSVQEATMDDIPLQDEMGSVEYRLLMVYAQRTRSASKFQHINQEGAQAEADGEHTIATNGNDHKRHKSSKGTKKKSKWLKRMTPKCLKPENDKKKKRKSLAANMVATGTDNAIARRLRAIIESESESEEICYRGLSVKETEECHSDDNKQLIMRIAKILRESGDSLDEEMQKNRSMFDQFRRALCYDFYKDFLNTYIGQLVPLTEPEVEKKRTAVALCFDVTSKLTTLDNQPMNKVLGFGAHYIKEYFTPWVESQGGWEKALDMETDKEVE